MPPFDFNNKPELSGKMIAPVTKPVIAIVDPYHPDAVTRLQSDPDIDVISRNDEGRSVYEEADAIMLRSETHIGETEFQRFKNLKYIVKQGVGMDNVDLEAAKRAGVEVYNTPGLNSESVAELALSLALCLGRRICEIDRLIRDGKTVARSQTLGRSLFKKVLGVVGMGNIGLALAKKWVQAMDGEVIAYDPYYQGKSWSALLESGAHRVDSLEDLLRNADLVSLHVPLTKSTSNLISTAEFASMKQDAILLNCARGGIVDEDALLKALSSGKLAGAGLDAVVVEPPTKTVYGALLRQENVIMTPHIGASTVENQSKSGMAVADIVLNLLRGEQVDSRVA